MKENDINYEGSLAPYFRSIKKSKGLSREEEAELGRRILEGDYNAVTELVTANLQFVVKTAKKYMGSGIPLDILVSGGNIGLYKAAERFDYRKGMKFITYAVWWIKSEIQTTIREYNGREEEVGFDEYDEFSVPDSDNEKYRENADFINNEYEEKLTELQSRGMVVDELMESLEEREKKILSLYFGLYGEKQMTLKEISGEMNMSSERVRQIANTSLTKLRSNVLASDHFEEYKSLR